MKKFLKFFFACFFKFVKLKKYKLWGWVINTYKGDLKLYVEGGLCESSEDQSTPEYLLGI